MFARLAGLAYRLHTLWVQETDYQERCRHALINVTVEQASEVLRTEPGSSEWRDGLMLLISYLQTIKRWQS